MRRTREATAESRQSIVTNASRLFRERGFDGVGVADIMAAAGLTHGGFYRHFSSKQALIGEAIAHAFADKGAQLEGNDQQEVANAVSAYVRDYLSTEHVACVANGCPIAALGSQAHQVGPSVEAAFAAGIEHLVGPIACALGDDAKEARADALRLIAALVGSIVIARASGSSNLSKEMLAAAHNDPVLAKLVASAERKTAID